MKDPIISVNCKEKTAVPTIKTIPHMETIKTTAKLFGLAEHFVRQLVVSGEIVAVKAGCKYLVNIDKFIEYLNTSKVTGQPGAEEKAVHSIASAVPVNFR